ncbi:MAG: GIY-YIG nuclease family protein [Desulfobacteria bacterium]
MPFWTYIIQSELTGRLYVGQTEHLDSRLERHNSNEP